MSAMSIISLVGASQGIFLGVVLFVKGRRYPAILALSAYVFLFSCGLLEIFHNRESSGAFAKVVFSFIANANLLYGPLLYLFVKLLLRPSISILQLLLHFTPFALFFTGDLLVVLNVIKLPVEFYQTLELVLFEFFVAQLLAYSLITVRLFRHSRMMLLATYSSFDRSDVDALYFILRSITFVYVLSFLLTHLMILGIIKDRSIFISVQILIAFITYYLGYRMYLRPSFLKLQLDDTKVEKQPVSKYQRSGLNESEVEGHIHQLLSYMENARPYKTAELTIYDVAAALNISRNHLTEILNVHLGVNFYEFINNYRVDESKRLLLDTSMSHLSMAGIGSEAGFRSPAAFYSNFKKSTGTTPANWKAQREQSPDLGMELE